MSTTNPLDTARAVAAACRSVADDCEAVKITNLGRGWTSVVPCALRAVSERVALCAKWAKYPSTQCGIPDPEEDWWGIRSGEDLVVAANDAAHHDIDRPRAVIAPLRALAARIDRFIHDMGQLEKRS